MYQVGDTYVDNITNRTYKCTSVITISPTLMRPNQSKTTTWKHVYTVSGESGEPAKTIILEDEDGNRVIAVLVDEEVDFTATANDIREGKVAATDDGVTIGKKFIPSYETIQGVKLIPSGRAMTITGLVTHDNYDYTKLQAIICQYNTNTANSMSSEMVVINDNVYEVQSVDSISVITKNHDNKTIDLGVTNNFGKLCVIRYITYKEVD